MNALFINSSFLPRKLESAYARKLASNTHNCGITEQSVTRRAHDPHLHQRADVARRTFEHDNLVSTCAARETLWIGFARSFAQDLDLLANKWFAAALGPGIHQFEQVMVTRFLHGIWQLLFHLRCRRALPPRIFENERVIESNQIDKFTCPSVVVVGFSGITNNDVRGDGNVRRAGTNLV